MSRPLRLDLHVHSNRSPDGRASVEELVAAAARGGLDGLALTDHNTVSGHRRLAELARDRPELRLIPGVEVSTREGHLLAYGVDAPPPPHRPVAESAEWVVAHGGVPVLAHPFRWTHGVGRRVAQAARVPALETVNGHNGRRANSRATAIAAARSLGTTGGSDAHRGEELGRAWTRFPEGSDAPDELLDALQRGTTVADGRSLGFGGRLAVATRSFTLRLGRGLRPI